MAVGCDHDARFGPGATIGIVGAGSFVAGGVVSRLADRGYRPRVLSLRDPQAMADVQAPIPGMVALCPIWGLVGRIAALAGLQVGRLVAVSSTSRFTKANSSSAAERAVARRLADAEEAVLREAAGHGVRVTILRPTLLYDGVHDHNVTAIAAVIRRWGWFPLLGAGSGLRQPLHADDLAAACVAALTTAAPAAAYELSGAETLTYRQMVERIFAAVGRTPRFLHVPRWMVRSAVPWVACLPRFRELSVAAFERMNEPLVFDHTAATRDLGFVPRPFLPDGRLGDVPRGLQKRRTTR